MDEARLKEIRRLVANLIASAGCSCCRNNEKWYQTQAELAEMLHVPMYSDGSGYDFYQFTED